MKGSGYKLLRKYAFTLVKFLLVILPALLLVLPFAAFSEPPNSSKGESLSTQGTSANPSIGVIPVQLATENQAALRSTTLETHDPRNNSFPSEVIASEIKNRLKRLAAYFSDSTRGKEAFPMDIIDADFSCTALRPQPLEVIFKDGSIAVLRADESMLDKRVIANLGIDGFIFALSELTAPHPKSATTTCSLKTFRLDIPDGGKTTETMHHVSVFATRQQRSMEQHATWAATWSLADNRGPLLKKIYLLDFEEIRWASSRSTWFTDCTKGVLGANESFLQQIRYGMGHWLKQIERIHLIDTYGVYGIASGDVNGDGLEDLYVCQPGGLPNRLYVQSPDGTALDRSADSGLDWLDHSSSALIVDIDNDYDQDVVIATYPQILVMVNDSMGRFTIGQKLPLADFDPHSLSAVDFDNDGDLDLYVCIELATRPPEPGEQRPAFLYHDANDGGANTLFRNNLERGLLTFDNVTQATGLDTNNRRHALAAAWEDYDNDGDQDLYVGNDYGKNSLYQNNNGRFLDIAGEADVVDQASGMSVSWGDYDRDGHMDLYVANMFSYAGSRITRQTPFKPTQDDSLRQLYQRFAKGNSLFHNLGDNHFEETSKAAAVEMGRWAWSSLFADLNNDGWEDLIVANGYISSEDTGDL